VKMEDIKYVFKAIDKWEVGGKRIRESNGRG
jgi:hypothetical protein